MRAKQFVAHFTTPSGLRRLPIRFFATSRRDALRIARQKAGKGLLFGLTLSGVDALSADAAATEARKKAA